jgi:hypothetical protein
MLETKRWIQKLRDSTRRPPACPRQKSPQESGIYGVFDKKEERKKTAFNSDRLKQSNI